MHIGLQTNDQSYYNWQICTISAVWDIMQYFIQYVLYIELPLYMVKHYTMLYCIALWLQNHISPEWAKCKKDRFVSEKPGI